MVLIDIYNQKITVYGDIEASFVTELEGEYSGFSIVYMSDVFDTNNY